VQALRSEWPDRQILILEAAEVRLTRWILDAFSLQTTHIPRIPRQAFLQGISDDIAQKYRPAQAFARAYDKVAEAWGYTIGVETVARRMACYGQITICFLAAMKSAIARLDSYA